MKRSIILIIGGVLILTGLLVFSQWYSYGTLIVTTSDSHKTISVKEVSTDSDPKESSRAHTGKKELKLRLKAGKYFISVSGNSLATYQTITLKPHSNLHVHLNPPQTSGMEPVLNKSISSLNATETSLVYLDPTDETLYKINQSNEVSALGVARRFMEVEWVNSHIGVGLDNTGKLYKIADSLVSSIPTPGGFSYPGSLKYAVSGDGYIFVSVGNTVFGGKIGDNLKQIYTSQNPHPTVVAHDQKVAILDGGADGTNKTSRIAVVSVDGKKFTKSTEGYVASWSQKGSYLLVSGDEGTAIYNDILKEVAVIPQANINNPVWLNNETVLMADNDKLWSYSVPNKHSQLLANTPLGVAINGLYIDENHSHVYLSTQERTGNNKLKRIGLADQVLPKVAFTLQTLLPLGSDSYSVKLVNFTHPTLYVEPYPDSAKDDVLTQAKNDLASYGIDLSQTDIRQASINQPGL